MPSSRQRGSLPRARKRFGQHFLVDAQALESIADLTVHDRTSELVVEIGPGRGALTRPLLSRLDRLVAIEIDRDLTAYLRDTFPAEALEIIEADVLRVDLDELARERQATRLIVAGNLPYNISAPVLFKMRENAALIRRGVFTLQKEVAQRLVASPGSRQYSLVSVLLGQCARVEMRQQLPAAAFRPVPKVDSAVVEISFEPDRIPVADLALFERIVRGAFSLRRKMLRNSLHGLAPLLEERDLTLADVATRAGVDLQQRAEDLGIGQYAALTRVIAERST